MREAEKLVRAGVQGTAGHLAGHERLRRRRRDTAPASGAASRCADAHDRPARVALGALGAWVRLHYVYPYPHVDEVIPLMASGRVLPYLDVPFQHASPRMLKLMRRPAHAREQAASASAPGARAVPELTMRSTFIVGFPGETEAEFAELLDVSRGGRARPRRLLRVLAGRGRRGQRAARSRCRRRAGGALRALHGARRRRSARAGSPRKVGRASAACWSMRSRTGGRSRAAPPMRPEIDGVVTHRGSRQDCASGSSPTSRSSRPRTPTISPAASPAETAGEGPSADRPHSPGSSPATS